MEPYDEWDLLAEKIFQELASQLEERDIDTIAQIIRTHMETNEPPE